MANYKNHDLSSPEQLISPVSARINLFRLNIQRSDCTSVFLYYSKQRGRQSDNHPSDQEEIWRWLFACEVLFGSGVPPASERLLQVESHLEGQVVLQLPGTDLHTQGQTFLTQTQRALCDRQPEDVDYTWG